MNTVKAGLSAFLFLIVILSVMGMLNGYSIKTMVDVKSDFNETTEADAITAIDSAITDMSEAQDNAGNYANIVYIVLIIGAFIGLLALVGGAL